MSLFANRFFGGEVTETACFAGLLLFDSFDIFVNIAKYEYL
tara:strand:- start:387 stop:509 length:123 start_codon:yes stop_codon:yes gene_type:complete